MQKESVVMQMVNLFERGYSSRGISAQLGWSAATVRRRLNERGIDLGGPGHRLEITQEYVDMTAQMRADGLEWQAISKKLGFSIRQLQRRLYGK